MSIRCLGCMKLKEQHPVCEHCGYNENVPNYAHQLPIGTVLHGQYTVGKVLGQGGFGITYIGWDDALEAPVAIKEYYPNSFVTRECTVSTALSCTSREMEELFFHNRDRFLREARMLARLQDVPGIVRVHNLFRENNTAYIVMEYVEGIDLKRYIRTLGRTLTVGETLAVLRPVMDALSLVHQAELVHRDISPDNIMIRPDGSAKLLDFGAAREVENPDVEKNLSQSTESILKHGFAPIEQYQRRGNLGPWTDVYALCATVYYCLTGKVPADAPERMIEQAEVNWNAIPGLTAKQAEVFAKGMAVLPKDRIRSIGELYQSLRDSTVVRQRKSLEQKPEKHVPEQKKQDFVVPEANSRGGAPTLPKDADMGRKKKTPMGIIAAAALALVAAVGLFAMKPKETPGTAAAPEIRPAATESAITEALSEEELRYQEAEALEAAGEYGKAAIAFGKLGDYANARERSFGLWENVIPRKTLFGSNMAIKKDNTVIVRGNPQYKDAFSQWKDIIDISASFGLRMDGTVLAAGENIAGECDVSGWTDIVDVVTGDCAYSIRTNPNSWRSYHQGYTLGLKADGTILATGDNNWGQCDVSEWTDILAIITDNYFVENVTAVYPIEKPYLGFDEAECNFNYYTVGLKADGTVVLAGKPPMDWDLSGWTDIVKISTDGEHIAGLKSDGTVVSTQYGQNDISGWKDITDIDAGPNHLLGLTSDGRVMAVGNKHLYNHLDVDNWTDIVAISASDRHTVGLKADGTVVAVGINYFDINFYGMCDVEDWSDIVAIETTNNLTVGLKADGTAIAAGGNKGKTDMSAFTDIKLPANIPTKTLSAAPTERTYTQIAAGLDHTVVLFSDGTVEAIGSNEYGQCDVEDWRDIVQVSALKDFTLGLKADGTMVATGYNYNDQCNADSVENALAVSAGARHSLWLTKDGHVRAVSNRNDAGECGPWDWDNIIAIDAAYSNSIALCEDGTVYVSGSYSKGKIPGWSNITAISASDAHFLGLRSDGTVMAAGSNSHDQCDVDTWTDIIAVGAGCGYSVGLRENGTVLVQGLNDNGQHEARSWKDIVYISVGLDHIIGVKADGTFVATGDNEHGECSVEQFNQ